MVSQKEELVQPHARIARSALPISRDAAQACQAVYRVQRQAHNAGTAEYPQQALHLIGPEEEAVHYQGAQRQSHQVTRRLLEGVLVQRTQEAKSCGN